MGTIVRSSKGLQSTRTTTAAGWTWKVDIWRLHSMGLTRAVKRVHMWPRALVANCILAPPTKTVHAGSEPYYCLAYLVRWNKQLRLKVGFRLVLNKQSSIKPCKLHEKRPSLFRLVVHPLNVPAVGKTMRSFDILFTVERGAWLECAPWLYVAPLCVIHANCCHTFLALSV